MTATTHPAASGSLPTPRLRSALAIAWILNLGSAALIVVALVAGFFGIGAVILGSDSESAGAVVFGALALIVAVGSFAATYIAAIGAVVATVQAAKDRAISRGAVGAAWVCTGLNIALHLVPVVYRYL